MPKLNLLKSIKQLNKHYHKNIGRLFYGRTAAEKADIDYAIICKERARAYKKKKGK
jgi:hypothetical protein